MTLRLVDRWAAHRLGLPRVSLKSYVLTRRCVDAVEEDRWRSLLGALADAANGFVPDVAGQQRPAPPFQGAIRHLLTKFVGEPPDLPDRIVAHLLDLGALFEAASDWSLAIDVYDSIEDLARWCTRPHDGAAAQDRLDRCHAAMAVSTALPRDDRGL